MESFGYSIIDLLNQEYTSNQRFSQSKLKIECEKIIQDGFCGSAEELILKVDDAIVVEAPGCLAAPKIRLIAKEKLSLGTAKRSRIAVPVRIFSPESFFITTRHLVVGEVLFLVNPAEVRIYCNKVTFIQHELQPYDCMDHFKKWFINPHVKVKHRHLNC